MKGVRISASTQYDILIKRKLITEAGCYIRKITDAERAVIVTDSNVAPIYGRMVCDSMEQNGFKTDIFVFEAGESSKRLSTIEKMYAQFAKSHITRTDIIVAVGGGVTGDMAGFAASTWLRGVDFVQIPTSLLAQIDSSVGGKTGVDLEEGKNLVGAFWQPKLVLIDPDTLNTLPKRFFSDGMAEAIKYGCIKSSELFELLENNDIFDILEDVIYKCVCIKGDVVERDEKESGERMLLNFGHTLGHAIEKFYNYTEISHGEAVGIGMLLMIKAGESAGLTEKGTFERVEKLLKKFDLPTETEADIETLCEFAGADKKCSGSVIRIVLLKKIGSSFTEAYKVNALERFVNGYKSEIIARAKKGTAYGTATAPASKSAAHRAIICAALAHGISDISPVEMSLDIKATCSAVSALGAEAAVSGEKIIVSGEKMFSEKKAVVNCGESGSTLRFMIPIAAAGGVSAEFTGEGRLPERPIGIYLDSLPEHGVKCVTKGGLPLGITGQLMPGRYEVAGNVSSQFITGLLLSLPLLDGDSDIILTTELESSNYIDMTVQMQKRFGVNVQKIENGWHIEGNSVYKAQNTEIEGDWSQAAFFMAMGAVAGAVTVNGIRSDSMQGDKRCAELFERFGAEVIIRDNSVTVSRKELHGIEIDARDIPDLVPVLAVTAALAKGTTVIRGAERLRIKESDRLESTANMINAIGGHAVQTEDGLIIDGVESFKGGKVDGCNDHRIVMSACVAAMRSEDFIEISDPYAIFKSYPTFYQVYNSLGGNVNVISMG